MRYNASSLSSGKELLAFPALGESNGWITFPRYYSTGEMPCCVGAGRTALTLRARGRRLAAAYTWLQGFLLRILKFRHDDPNHS